MEYQRREMATSDTALVETPEVEQPDMHIPDTRLSRALMESRVAEAKRIGERDWSRRSHPGMWTRIGDRWHEIIESMTIRPPKLPGGGHWGQHRPLHH